MGQCIVAIMSVNCSSRNNEILGNAKLDYLPSCRIVHVMQKVLVIVRNMYIESNIGR